MQSGCFPMQCQHGFKSFCIAIPGCGLIPTREVPDHRQMTEAFEHGSIAVAHLPGGKYTAQGIIHMRVCTCLVKDQVAAKAAFNCTVQPHLELSLANLLSTVKC